MSARNLGRGQSPLIDRYFVDGRAQEMISTIRMVASNDDGIYSAICRHRPSGSGICDRVRFHVAVKIKNEPSSREVTNEGKMVPLVICDLPFSQNILSFGLFIRASQIVIPDKCL